MAGQTISDRFLAARHSIAGQGLAKAVCKATTEEMIGPKKKHLDYLIHCTNEPNVSIPQLANHLIERSQNSNWVVVYKALITVHHMMCYGNERFTQYLASSNSTFQLSNFLDKSGVQGYDMSPFIRRYAKYLNEKALSYRTVAFDFCKVKRGKEDGTLRTMNAEKLLKTLPVLQSQLDALLEFDCSPNDLTNGVINMAFMLLFRDLIRLFACYNDGIINLLEKYFDMNKKQCRDALDLYKKFLIRMDRVGEFLKVAENVGIDKGDIPDLTKAPSSLLDALEQHLNVLEGKKGSAANTPTQSASNRTNVKSGVNALSTTSTSFGSAASSARLDQDHTIDEDVRRQALAEEEAAMNQYKAKVQSPTSAASTNPFLSSPTTAQPLRSTGSVDLFGPTSIEVQPVQSHATKASDDLLQLSGNPFADVFNAPAAPPPVQTTVPVTNTWVANGFGGSGAPVSGTFVSDKNFSSVFGDADISTAILGDGGSSAANPFTDLDLGPPSSSAPPVTGNLLKSGDDLVGGAGDDFPPTPAPSPSPIPLSRASDTPPQSSPARQPVAASKSAFDDLNDSIRAALGTSPARPTAPIGAPGQGPGPAMVPPGMVPQGMVPQGIVPPGGVAPGGGPTGPVPVALYGSPLKQPFAAAGAGGVGGVAGVAGSGTPAGTGSPAGKVLTGDLDSSLASLAENLTMNKSAQQSVKGVQWNSPKNAAKTGGVSGWTPQPMAATTGANYRPMGQGMASTLSLNMNVNMPSHFAAAAVPHMQGMGVVPVAGMAPGVGVPGVVAPGVGAPGMAPMRPMMGVADGGVGAGANMMGAPLGVPAGVPAGVPQQGPAQPPTLDPFGAL